VLADGLATVVQVAHEILDAAKSSVPGEPIVVRVRKLTAVIGMTAVTALAMSGLTACDSLVGQAAIVGDHRISESDLGKYVLAEGPAPSALAAAAKSGTSVFPKSEVVQFLIQQELFERWLAKNGGVPGNGELATTLHDQAATVLLGSQLTGAQLDAALEKQLISDGTSAKFLPVVLRTFELEMALVAKVNAKSVAEVAVVVNKLNIKVQVNPRYGKWDAKTVSMTGPTSNIPDFLKLEGVSTAPTAPASN
jgi:hypothetical protein